MRTFEDLVAFLLEHDCRIHVKQSKTLLEAKLKRKGRTLLDVGTHMGPSYIAIFSRVSREDLYKNIMFSVPGRTLTNDLDYIIRVPELETP